MKQRTKDISDVAEKMGEWFEDFMKLCDSSVFSMTHDQSHQNAIVLHLLTRNSKEIVNKSLDAKGDLYTPLCFALAAACRRLGISPSSGNWRAAVENVLDFREKLRNIDASSIYIPLGSAASIFKGILEESLINAGVTDHPTILDDENRKSALGLAINWGIRFLIAYALEIKARKRSKPKGLRDLAWVRNIVENLEKSGHTNEAKSET